MTSPAKTLADIATPEGTFAIVAMDQRNTIKRMYAAVGAPEPTDQDMVDLKADVIAGVGDLASAFLLDPTYGLPALAQVPNPPGVLLAAEPAARNQWEGEPRATYDAGQDARWVLDRGADALKYFVQMLPGRTVPAGTPDLTSEWMDLTRTVIADCRTAGVPAVIENLIYQPPGEPDLTPERRADEVIEAARMLSDLGPDLLKLEYPGSPQACRRLASAIDVPWAVLSAGVPFEQFTPTLRIACDDGGAAGFIAGRAIWRETVGMHREPRRTYLADIGRRRLEECVTAIAGRAQPITNRISSPDQLTRSDN